MLVAGSREPSIVEQEIRRRIPETSEELLLKATWRDRVIAESDDARAVDGYVYFPRDAVRMDWLHAAPRSASDRLCAHGVQFYDLDDGSARSERAAWSYEAPRGAMKHVDRWIGFWGDVEID